MSNILLLSGILILLFVENWRAGLSLSLFSAIAMLILYSLRNIAVSHSREARQASSEFYGFLEERLSGTEDIKANSGIPFVLLKFFHFSRPYYMGKLKTTLMGSVIRNTTSVLFALTSAFGLALGAYLFKGNLISNSTV